jgi:hypothetical protein
VHVCDLEQRLAGCVARTAVLLSEAHDRDEIPLDIAVAQARERLERAGAVVLTVN